MRTGATGSSISSIARAVAPLTATMAAARAALAGIIRRKKTTLERSCHSGWSKNVRSWMVTTLGSFARSGIV